MKLENTIINKRYLFLDRDGVINKRIWNGYISNWEDFHFIDGVLESLVSFSHFFDRIFIVTNQQGIGKGLMTKQDVENIHQHMIKEIYDKGGKIDAVYYCGDLKTLKNNCRKPGIKMAEMIKKDYPEIDFEKSLMIGDTKSDMDFANNLGMLGILVKTEYSTDQDLSSSNYSINTLDEIVKLLK